MVWVNSFISVPSAPALLRGSSSPFPLSFAPPLPYRLSGKGKGERSGVGLDKGKVKEGGEGKENI